ncbi:ubiquinone biosynthesis protein COQ4 mitochondrial [Dacryopinax primogenitus]|uniref:4-hydroxy-3-methoxy-5-polyprenylbenzoate decarboxylase n=1 Tax=Dacryopinax primogenitus (strain DJM 731) TaxID=1858805 RepID=M5GDU6_DACPD|nr:ubiquinone biosynthesis protein COQ4 mitochondrial [Dacryopinax primogenitus]EJU04852.1 ubiquinone biosynthesis protein COQ4 mitochondrial [Dacryopinax primogenitus]
MSILARIPKSPTQLPRAALALQGRRHRSAPAYPGHIPLNAFENAFLAVGSGITALLNPRRGDMVAALGETTGQCALPGLLDKMLSSPEGRRVLKARPRVNTDTVSLPSLRALPANTFGNTYVSWLDRTGVTPDTRSQVHYINDPELAYVMQRYRECHDFYHTLFGFPVSVQYELALKVFEALHFGLPMAYMSALLGPLRVKSELKAMLLRDYVPWAMRVAAECKPLITVYWEERWEQDLGELKAELGAWDPPVEAKWGKKLTESDREAARRAKAAAAESAGDASV